MKFKNREDEGNEIKKKNYYETHHFHFNFHSHSNGFRSRSFSIHSKLNEEDFFVCLSDNYPNI